MIRLGYACKVLGVPGTATRTCTLKNATKEGVLAICRHNIQALQRMVAYTNARGLGLLRISSGIIPLASHPEVHSDWQHECAAELTALGEAIRASGIRVSMHPGQYTVLNSPHDDVVQRAKQDLAYHADFLDALGVDGSCKLVLHVGGVYGDRPAALRRFFEQAGTLPSNVLRRLVLENDERCFAIHEVVALCRRLKIPAVFDVFHHSLNPAPEGDLEHWLNASAQTWATHDGRQKIHYSQQLEGGKPGMHSRTIALGPFMELYASLRERPVDVMLEVKDKNLSAVKCLNCITPGLPRQLLAEEWARYKYAVLERSSVYYVAMREYMKGDRPDALEFYRILGEALEQPLAPGQAVNAAQHVWGYVNGVTTAAEKKRFASALQRCALSLSALPGLKRMLYALAERRESPYLLQSLYFCEL